MGGIDNNSVLTWHKIDIRMRLRIGGKCEGFPRAFSPIRAEYVYQILCQVNALLLSILQSLGNDHLTWRGGGLWFFSEKNILIPNVAEKNILIVVEEKKNNMIQSFCHIT